ncbi:hypothetical protein HR060_06485 [Catenovulum sp. SM1970]|nr:hypothetical protein [Marinifaba aquimaris]
MNACSEQGINPALYPSYPDFPRTDWQGNPSHASGGDYLSHENRLYKARWWTQQMPTDNASEWQFVCAF